MKNFCIYILTIALLSACGNKPVQQQATIEKADFNADSAYLFIKQQVEFGPRTLNSEAHMQCVEYLCDKLASYGAQVEVQTGTMTDYENKDITIKNIIGKYNPNKANRILLAAHYDSRPWADNDADINNRHTPILGANDGASGVGVLLEIARQLQISGTTKGIDIVFFDAEDMGAPQFYSGEEKEDDWCLGSQYWAQQIKDNNAVNRYNYGIVLDMVGAGDAVFPQEYFSLMYASNKVKDIWKTAQQLGYGQYFDNTRSYPITDDHYYVSSVAGIPCVDIIHYNTQGAQNGNGFPRSWHTVADNMEVINKATLNAVGTTIMTVVK